MGDEATKYLEDQDAKLQEALAELEKKKKAKKGKKDVDEEIDERGYKYLPKELLQRMLAKRMQEDDCNAGAIFDNLTCQYWPDEKFGIELICEAVPKQNVELVLFTFNQERAEGDDEQSKALEVCTNYRYARRHDPHHMVKEDEKQDEREDTASPLTKRPSKAPQKPKPGAKGKKDAA